MALNFNVSPYFDDFDPTKNFHRILFKPGSAVQARELTQSQTILQDQISKFAANIFTQNTPITGGNVTTNLTCYYLKLNLQYGGVNITAGEFLNKTIQDSTGTVLAKVIATVEGTLGGDNPTLIVTYFSGVQFSDGMTITPTDGTNIAATTIGTAGNSTSTGLSSVASISDGVFYVVNGYSLSSIQNQDGSYSKYSVGNFVSVQPQTTILSKYSNSPSVRVGLKITETVVDYIADTSLLDPAIGASNYQAPGADRYQITLELVTLPLTPGNDDQFIELLRIESGQIVKQVNGTSYSVIDDYFAKRDYETNGDYVVNDFKLTPITHPSDNNYYDIKVGKGVAYVHGYRIENQSELTLVNSRARETAQVTGNDVFVDYGSYFYVNNVNGLFDVTTVPTVHFHSVAVEDINTTNTSTYIATLAGTGFIRNLSYVSDSSNANTESYVYKAYVSDINATSLSGFAIGSGSSSTTIKFNNPGNIFSGANSAYVGTTITITNGTSQGDTRKIISYDGVTYTATVDNAFTLTPDNTTEFSLLFSTAQINSIVESTPGTPYTINVSSNINPQFGKVNGLLSGDTIFNNPGTPELLFSLGSSYVADLSSTTYFSTKVFRNKTFTGLGGSSSLTISMPSGSSFRFAGSGTLDPDAVKQLFTVIDTSNGDILDFSSSGNTVTISSGTSATFTSSAYTGKTVDIISNGINLTNADTTNYVLKSKNLVNGNTSIVSTSGPSGVVSSTYIDLTNGQVYIQNADINPTKTSLYVSDVKSIVKIIDTKDPGVAPTTDMLASSLYDVTNLFTLDNGQKDTYYDHASLSLKAGANPPKGNILVIFNFYSHSGGDGYFSVRSYLGSANGGVSTSPENYAEISSYTTKNGHEYKLTDSLDFRPSRKNAQANLVFEYSGTPSSDDTGVLIPNNLSSFVNNYTYYLGRKDKLVLTKDKNFQIISGSSAINPVLPVEPDGALVLAELIHDPYTAYIPGEGPSNIPSNLSVNKIINKRWTMSDITDLETRIENLEYYTSLNLLEQKAQSLQIPDSNGLNRFKNGILVDDFSDYSTADTSNPDFIANINIRKQQLTPLTDVRNFRLQNPVVLNSLGTVTTTNNYEINSINLTQTNVFTLPYTTKSITTQPLASNIISVNPFAVISQKGIVSLNPPMDNWVDSTIAPSVLNNSPFYQIYQADSSGLNVINAGDFASITGTPLSSASSLAQSGTTNQNNSTGLSLNNGYVVNNNVLPYIRQQPVIINAKGLLVNTPISTWFDGVNVDQYITLPNTIELNGTTGTFNEGDIVGFYYDNKFHPIGRVVSVMTYAVSVIQQITNAYIVYLKRTPDASGLAFWNNAVTSGAATLASVIDQIATSVEAKNYETTGMVTLPAGTRAASISEVVNPVRLSVATIQGYIYAPVTTNLQNAQFDSSGNYTGSTANGTVSGEKILNLSRSGTLSGVGGTYTANNISGTAQIYRVMDPNEWGTFLNQYGVWGDVTYDASGNATNPYAATFVVDFPQTGTYTFTSAASGSSTTTLESSTVVTSSSPTNPTTITTTVTAGTHNVAWSATNTTGPAGYALTIKDSSGNFVFDSTNPSNVYYDTVASDTTLSGGGYWFTGATKIQLDSNASANNDFYTGGTIHVSSTYVLEQPIDTANIITQQNQHWETVTTTTPVTTVIGYTYQDFVNGIRNRDNTYWLSQGFTQAQIDVDYAEILSAAEIIGGFYKSNIGRLPEVDGMNYWGSQYLNPASSLYQNQTALFNAMYQAASTDGEPIAIPPGGSPSATIRRDGVVAGDFLDRPDTVTTTYVSGTSNVLVTTIDKVGYSYNIGDKTYASKTYTYTANIIAYDGTTKVATLDQPINVSLGYNSLLGDITSQYNIVGTESNISAALMNGGAPVLSTDENGNFSAVFTIPSASFHVGQKVFRIDNRLAYTLPETATTYAQATFFASGLSDKTQQSEFSSSFDSSVTTFTQVSQQSNQLVTTLTAYTPHDPIAQTFQISKDNFANGAFISSVKLFFAAKPIHNVPVTVSIVGTLNGVPNGNVLDNSTVTLDVSKINTSSRPHYLDSTTYTEFVFPAPVYIKSGTLYAILVESSSPEYYLYIAKQNEFALSSTSKALPTDDDPTNPSKIGTIPSVGNLFETQNSITWVPNQTTDLMFDISRCVFNTAIVNSSIPFQLPKNAPTRTFAGQEVQYKLNSNVVSNLYGSFLTPLESDEYNVTTTDFVPTSTSLTYTYRSLYNDSGVPTLTSATTISPGKYGCPTSDNISLNDGNGSRIIDPYRNDSFTLYANMSTKDDAVSPIISDDGVSVYNIKYAINDMGIGNNVISLTNGGSGYNVACTYATISAPEYGSAPNLGVTIVDGVVTNVYVVGGNIGSGYITTPTITITDANSAPGMGATVTVSGETSPTGGNGFARYFTKVVTLTPENDSGDLRVFTTAYWPVGAQILMYYKILNRNDTQNFEQGSWQLMTPVTNVNKYSATNGDLIEYEFAPGMNNTADNSISYTSTNGQTYNKFSQFAIKVVFATSDNTVIPFLSDLRAIALPSGTGF